MAAPSPTGNDGHATFGHVKPISRMTYHAMGCRVRVLNRQQTVTERDMIEIPIGVHVDGAIEVPTDNLDNQLVVPEPDLELVTGQLTQLGIQPTQAPEIDAGLHLALIKFSTAAAVDSLMGRLRSTDFAATVVTAPNPHMSTVHGMVQPFPQTRPHHYVLTDDLKPAPTPPSAFRAARGGAGVHVGVLDTPVPDIAGQSEYLLAGHATFVTSLILAQAPEATVIVPGIPDAVGRTTAWDVVQGLLALADAGADVIYLPFGCRTDDDKAPLVLSRAVEQLSQRVVLVAAAGNHHLSPKPAQSTWPAALKDVVAVGARNADDTMADFSPRVSWVDCTAPGSQVSGAYLTGTVRMLDGTSQEFTGDATWSGTALAAATVAGAIAARTVPGTVTAHEALRALLAEDGGVVRKYVPGDDGQCA
jgi:Subtilase family